MRHHIFPRINFENMALRRIRMRAEGFAPRKPPVVGYAFLFAADIAVKSFCPGQGKHPAIFDWTFLSNASLQDRPASPCNFLDDFYLQTGKATEFHISILKRPVFTQESTGVPQIFCGCFIRMQHLLDRIYSWNDEGMA